MLKQYSSSSRSSARHKRARTLRLRQASKVLVLLAAVAFLITSLRTLSRLGAKDTQQQQRTAGPAREAFQRQQVLIGCGAGVFTRLGFD